MLSKLPLGLLGSVWLKWKSMQGWSQLLCRKKAPSRAKPRPASVLQGNIPGPCLPCGEGVAHYGEPRGLWHISKGFPSPQHWVLSPPLTSLLHFFIFSSSTHSPCWSHIHPYARGRTAPCPRTGCCQQATTLPARAQQGTWASPHMLTRGREACFTKSSCFPPRS